MLGHSRPPTGGKLEPDGIFEHPENGIGLNVALGIEKETVGSPPRLDAIDLTGHLSIEKGPPVLTSDSQMVRPIANCDPNSADEGLILGLHGTVVGDDLSAIFKQHGLTVQSPPQR
jgi:hypothetical protein